MTYYSYYECDNCRTRMTKSYLDVEIRTENFGMVLHFCNDGCFKDFVRTKYDEQKFDHNKESTP